MGLDSIDIEDLATTFKNDFVSHFTNLAMTKITIGLGPFAPLVREFVEWIVTVLGTQGGLIAFMFNTNVFTTDQGQDYVKEAQLVNSLPDDVSDHVWEEAERRRVHAFVAAVNYRK